MSRPSKANQLLEKSVNAAVSAIEVYNKPDFRYREEQFSILMVNAWELLLKGKLLVENNNKLSSLYVKQAMKNKKGNSTSKWKYKTTRSGNKMTAELFGVIERLRRKSVDIPLVVEDNLNLLVEIRDNAIHFYNPDQFFSLKVQEVGLASLKNYVNCVREWFDYDLEKYNFYLMPLTFFHPYEIGSFSITARDRQQDNLLKFIAAVEDKNNSTTDPLHAITLRIETRLERSKNSGAAAFRITNDPSAPAITLKEEQLRQRYQWDYDALRKKLSDRYSDFKVNKVFYGLKAQLEEDTKYCWKRPYNPEKPSNGSKAYFDPNIIQEFDKYYTKRK